MTYRLPIGAALLSVFLVVPLRVSADEIPQEYRKVVDKGLEWVAKSQNRDGHWDANGGQYPTTMTSLAGMTLLMEGSTVREGPYAKNIRSAADWMMSKSMRGGNANRSAQVAGCDAASGWFSMRRAAALAPSTCESAPTD